MQNIKLPDESSLSADHVSCTFLSSQARLLLLPPVSTRFCVEMWVTRDLLPRPFKPQSCWAALRGPFQAVWQEPQEERLTVTPLLLPAVISNCSGGMGEGHFSLCEPLHGSTILYFSLGALWRKEPAFQYCILIFLHKQKGNILGIFYLIDFSETKYL